MQTPNPGNNLYSIFCSPMVGRMFGGDKYRFGFNGKEKDDELKGAGNSLDFGGRIYDSRLGRWLSLDPLMAKYPSFSPYNFCTNNPIMFIDPDGESVKPSLLLRIFHPKLYKAALEVIKSEEGKALFKDFATKRQAKKYWGINEKGKYSDNVDVVFTKTENDVDANGKCVTKFNGQTNQDVNKNGLSSNIDANTKLKISIQSSSSGINGDDFNAIVENYAHETFIHASFDLAFITKVFSNGFSNDEFLKEISCDSFTDLEKCVPGSLTTDYQHYLHYYKKISAYENFSTKYREGLSGEEQKIYEDEVSDGREGSETDAVNYEAKTKKNE